MRTRSNDGKLKNNEKVPWLTILAVSYGFFALNFVNYLMTPMFPLLLKQAGISEAAMQTATSIIIGAYSAAGAVTALAIALCIPSDSSKTRLQMISLLTTAISMPMSFLAHHFSIMVAARLLQGGAVGVLWLSGLATVTEGTPEHMVGTVVGIVTLTLTSGCMLGPLAGAAIFERSYATRVATIVGLALLLAGLVPHFIRQSGRSAAQSNPAGEPMQNSGVSGHSSPPPSHEHAPLLGPRTSSSGHDKDTFRALTIFARLLRSHTVLAGAIGLLAACSTLAALDSVLAIFARRQLGWSSGQTSSVWLFLTLPQLFSPVTGYLADRYGFMRVLRAGLLCAAFACAALTLTVLPSNAFAAATFYASLMLVGAGVTMVISTCMAQVSLAAERASRAANSNLSPGEGTFQSGALVNLSLALPGVIGPLWSSAVQGASNWIPFCLSLAAVNSVSLLILSCGKMSSNLGSFHDDDSAMPSD